MTLDNINWAAVDRIIRVDHAGEYGANRIYAGQMAVLGRTSIGPAIQVRISLSLSLTCHTGSCLLKGGTVVPKRAKISYGGGGEGVKKPVIFIYKAPPDI